MEIQRIVPAILKRCNKPLLTLTNILVLVLGSLTKTAQDLAMTICCKVK